MYQSQFIPLKGEKGRGRKFKVPDSSLFRCGTVSTGNSDIPYEKSAQNFKIEQWKDNGILLKNNGKFRLLFLKPNYLFPKRKTI